MDVRAMDKFKKNKIHSYPKVRQEYIEPSNGPVRRATFQSAMKFTIIIGQCFGLNPVLGVCELDTPKLRFSYFSGRSIYSLLSILAQGTVCGFCLVKFVQDVNTSFTSNTSIVFYSSTFTTTVLFYRLALKWPKLCKHISRTEAADPSVDTTLIKKCNLSCALVLILALLEHVLSDLAGWAFVIDCHPDEDVYKTFMMNSFSYVFSAVPYNHCFGFMAQMINVQCTFNWSFADLFVICLSFYLTSRLQQVNHRIVAVKGKYVPVSFWRSIREDYNRSANLVRRVDEVIGGIIFISFANNLFFICLQLFHTLADGVRASPSCRNDGTDDRLLHGYEHPIYFVYSFVFLVARSTALSLIAARVHTASREPAFTLYNIPTAAYCAEVKRLLDQIHGETIALSGLQFFNVKRDLLLAVTGTIVTYELVLLQFAGVTPTTPVS